MKMLPILSDTGLALLGKVFSVFPALMLLMECKGGFVAMRWTRPVKTLAQFNSFNITKTVSCVGRVGLNHESRAAVQEARASGDLPAVNTGLPWGEWLYFPWFITHKGKLYVRLYPVENRKPKVTFHLNGRVTSKEQVAMFCQASELREVDSVIGVMTLNVENLRSVKYRGETVKAVSSVPVFASV